MAETEFKYDVFISYSSANKDWARKDLLSALEKAGLKVCIDFRDFQAGKPALRNMRDSILESRHTLLVLTEAYLGSGWTEFENLLAQTLDPANRQTRVVPMLREKCKLPLEIGYLTYVNFCDPDDWDIAWKQLFSTLGKPDAKPPNAQGIDSQPQAPSESTLDVDKNARIQNTIIEGLNWKGVNPSIIFDGRLRDAFPGLRGVQKFQNEKAIERLQVLLREPLFVDLNDLGVGQIIPFWWLRGQATMHIQGFERLDANRMLLNIEELRIKYIVAVREFSAEERNFVYVHAMPEKPTGLYKYPRGWLKKYLQHHLDEGWGYYFYEEYGLWNNKLITRQEHDDGAAVIDGSPIRTSESKLRVRYLTSYNFVICGQDHVLNSVLPNVDETATKILDEILLGTKTVDNLIEFIAKLPINKFSRI